MAGIEIVFVIVVCSLLICIFYKKDVNLLFIMDSLSLKKLSIIDRNNTIINSTISIVKEFFFHISIVYL